MLFAYATEINELMWPDSMNINDEETHIFLLLELMIVFIAYQTWTCSWT